MALVALAQPYWPWPFNDSNFSLSANSISTSTSRVAVAIRAPKTGTLDSCEFKSGGSSSTLRVSFQDIDLATGFPDGTVDQYRTIATPSAGWQVPGLITDDGTNTGVKRSVVKGEYFAIVFDFTAFVDAITISDTMAGLQLSQWEHRSTYNGAAWAAGIGSLPGIVLKYDDGSYACAAAGPCVIPAASSNQQTFKSSDSPNEYGNVFQSPYDARIGGVTVLLNETSLGAYDVTLYDASSTVLATRTAHPTQSSAGSCVALIPFTASVDITKNTIYRLSVKPTTTTNVRVYYFDVNSVAIMAACPMGSAMYSSSRTGSGAWTDLTTRRLVLAPFYTALPSGAGA